MTLSDCFNDLSWVQIHFLTYCKHKKEKKRKNKGIQPLSWKLKSCNKGNYIKGVAIDTIFFTIVKLTSWQVNDLHKGASMVLLYCLSLTQQLLKNCCFRLTDKRKFDTAVRKVDFECLLKTQWNSLNDPPNTMESPRASNAP